MSDATSHSQLANAIRFLSIDAVNRANSGHPGAPMGMADMAVALWKNHLKHNPNNPDWLNRDRFVLSNGHASMLQYSVLHLTGYDLSLDELWLLSDGNCFRNHAINLCGEEGGIPKKLKFGYKTGNLDVLIRFVDMHYGYTLLPYLTTLSLSDEQQKHLRYFKQPEPKREISIVVPKGFLRQKLLNAVKQEIQANIPKELKHLDNGKIINWK